MVDYEFKAWGKIPRVNKADSVIVSEKIDGTNGCVVVQNGEVIGAQSRNTKLSEENDNYGFYKWCQRNKEQLNKLGNGYHYGEWAGLGIQKNPMNLPDKQFFLFNTYIWGNNPGRPECCNVVPTLYQGGFMDLNIDEIMFSLLHSRDYDPEGIIIYFVDFNKFLKHTYKMSEGKYKLTDTAE